MSKTNKNKISFKNKNLKKLKMIYAKLRYASYQKCVKKIKKK
jgi:hypothetical protein